MTQSVHAEVSAVTQRIVERSRASRAAYLARCERAQRELGPLRGMSCANLAHGYAALPADDKLKLRVEHAPNLGIVTAYNDMLSAHQPYERYPSVIREAARAVGGVAQVAGGVPAMSAGRSLASTSWWTNGVPPPRFWANWSLNSLKPS